MGAQMIHFGLSREITREGWGWGASRLGALHGREGEGGLVARHALEWGPWRSSVGTGR
jgi:hypothetical protein